MARRIIEDLPKECLEFVHQDEESESLAEEYVRQEVVVALRMLVDAQHIAVATVARVDVLVSWNFRHIVNLDRILWIQRGQSSIGISNVGDPIASGGLER